MAIPLRDGLGSPSAGGDATYEVVWDGSHQDCNADLLCTPAYPIRPAPTAEATAHERILTADAVYALVARAEQPCTGRTIAAATHTTSNTASTMLLKLMRHNLLTRHRIYPDHAHGTAVWTYHVKESE